MNVGETNAHTKAMKIAEQREKNRAPGVSEAKFEALRAQYRLTEKQLNAALWYLQLGQKTAAYRKAYAATGPASRISRKAYDLFRNPKVEAFVQAKQAKMLERTRANIDRQIDDLANVAFGNVTTVARIEDGQLYIKDPNDWTAAERAMVKSVRKSSPRGHGATRITQVKFHDKLAAMKKMARIFGLS